MISIISSPFSIKNVRNIPQLPVAGAAPVCVVRANSCTAEKREYQLTLSSR